MKKKRGRPPLPEEERLSETVAIAVTRKEADRICRDAMHARLGISPYMRLKLKDLGFWL